MKQVINNKREIIIALLLFIINIFSNHIFYNHEPYGAYLYPYLTTNCFILKYIIIKLIDFIIIYAIIISIKLLYKKIKEKNNFSKLFFEGFIICLIILSLTLIKHFPGVWSGDTLHIYEYATALKLIPWHNIYTSLFYIIALSLIPHLSGIVLFQIIIISLIVAYIYANLFKENKTRFRYLIFLIVLTPINSFYANWVFRTTLSSYLELFAIFFIIFNINKNISNKKFILFCLLTAFIASYRSENIFYLLLPIILKSKSLKHIIKTFFLTVIIMAIINIPQKILSSQFYSYDYLIASTLEPLQFILNTVPFNEEAILNEQKNIEKIIPYEYIKNYGSHSFFEYNYENTGFGTFVNKDKADQKDYLISTFKLFFKYNRLFIKSKVNLFSEILINRQIFTSNAIHSIRTEYFFEKQSNELTDHINSQFKLNKNPFIVNYEKKLIFPLSIIILTIIINLIYLKKEFFILLPIIAKLATIILFAPISAFMYFYYIYLIGYFIIYYYLSKALLKFQKTSET